MAHRFIIPARDTPEEILQSEISGLTIEFLHRGDSLEIANKIKNHVTLKANLRHTASFDGAVILAVRISFDVDSKGIHQEDRHTGAFLVKLLDYAGPSNSTVYGQSIVVRPGVSVGQLLDTAFAERMDTFDFLDNGYGMQGCRDAIGQYMHQLRVRGYIDPRLPAGRTIFETLNFRYMSPINYVPKRIDRGDFLHYQRVAVSGMQYS